MPLAIRATLAPALALALLAPSTLYAQTPPASPDATGAPATSAPPRQRPPRIVRLGVTTPGIQRPLDSIEKIATFPVEGSPDWSVVVPAGLWVSSASANHVVQLLSSSNTVGIIADVPRPCAGIISAFDSIWVPSCAYRARPNAPPPGNAAQPARYHPPRPRHRQDRPPPSPPTPPTPRAESPPEPAPSGSSSNRRSSSASTPRPTPSPPRSTCPANPKTPPSPMASSGSPATATTRCSRSIPSRCPSSPPSPSAPSRASSSPATAPSGRSTRATAASPASTSSPAKLVATIPCGIQGSGGDITFGEGSVWAAMFDFPITQVDPKTNAVVKQWAGNGGDGIRAGGGSIWLSNLRQGNVLALLPQPEIAS